MADRVVQILKRVESPIPSIDVYIPGTLNPETMTPGVVYAGNITELRILPSSTVTQVVSLSLIDENGASFPLLERVNVSRRFGIVDLLERLEEENGLQIATQSILRLSFTYPEFLSPDEPITVTGTAEEAELGTTEAVLGQILDRLTTIEGRLTTIESRLTAIEAALVPPA